MSESVQAAQYDKVLHLLQINRLEDAINQAQEYIREYPQDSDGYGLLAKIYYQKESYKNALHWAEEGLKLDPYSYLSWRVKVSTYYDLDDSHHFNETVLHALEVYPNDAFFYYLIGNRLNSSGKHKEANEYFQKSVQLEPYNGIYVAVYSYSNALLDEHEKSLEYERQALELDADNSLVFLHLGWAATQRGNYEKAIDFLTNAVRLDPQSKQIRSEYLSILQQKYKIYRFFTFPSTMKQSHLIIMWIGAWLLFKPLVLLFIFFYVLSHWGTKLLVHVKVFGWTFRRA